LTLSVKKEYNASQDDIIRAQDSEIGSAQRDADAGNGPDAGRGNSTGEPHDESSSVDSDPKRLHFPDGSSRLATASPLAGLRAVAACAAFGITATHDPKSIGRALVVVTEIRAPRKAKRRIRESVVVRLAQSDDTRFGKTVRALCASRDEVALARRIQALRNVGTRTEEDRQTRRDVGVQVAELRSR
jgi:hypothetical protein